MRLFSTIVSVILCAGLGSALIHIGLIALA
jgi:hypothetical protein